MIIILSSAVGYLVYNPMTSQHDDGCFESSKKAFNDAQIIRDKANSMGWEVSKVKSIAAGSFIKSKAILYPNSKLTICLKEEQSELFFKVQSAAMDAGHAQWRALFAKEK